jgi:hypothetical protein
LGRACATLSETTKIVRRGKETAITIAYPWKADPAVWCGGSIAALMLWCQDEVEADFQANTYPELVPLTRAIGTTISRGLPNSDEPEIWWIGDLFYLPRPPSVGRSWFDGVLVTREHPPSPVQTVLRGSAYAHTDTGIPVDTLHSFVQLEGPISAPIGRKA